MKLLSYSPYKYEESSPMQAHATAGARLSKDADAALDLSVLVVAGPAEARP
jgi:hypothetical protein